MTRFCRPSCASRHTRSAGTPRRSISTRCSSECWTNSDTRRCKTPSGRPRCPCLCIGRATDCPSGASSRRGAEAKRRCSDWLTNWKRRGHGRRSARPFLPVDMPRGRRASAKICGRVSATRNESRSKSRRPDEVFPLAPVNVLILAPVCDPPVVYLDRSDSMVAMRPVVGIFHSPNLPLFIEQDRSPRGPLLIALVVLKERAQLLAVVELISQRVRIMYFSCEDLTGPFVVAPRPGVGQRFEHGLEFCSCHLFAFQEVYLLYRNDREWGRLNTP